ncbi:MAG: ammonium transporter [Spirochaetales bacterium]|nr:ammonium transporter [Spirochaetales bacterium]
MAHTPVDILWIIVASALVFIMRVGFAMLESGMVRSKNAINVSTKVLTDLGVAFLAYWLVGFGLMFGSSQGGLWGSSYFALNFNVLWTSLFFLFHAMFASTGATIVSGAVAERIKFSSYLFVTVLFAALVYPVLGHWVWGGSLEGTPTGWLAKLGFVDFAGSTVVHSTGGWVSLAVLLVLGPRLGRYNADGRVNRITGAGLQTSIFGTLILWFGWFGFNGGSTLALNDQVPAIILKTSLSGASGMIVTLLAGWRLRRYPDVGLVINGALAGLVGATASAPFISAGSAVLVGAVSGIVMLLVEAFLDKLRIDDAVTAIPVHLGAGIWGTLAVGLFGDPLLLKTGLDPVHQTLIQLLGIVSCGAWAFGVTFLIVKLANRFFPIRVSAFEEAQGLNVVEHKASTEIYDLYKTLEDQSRTGDLSLRAPVEPFTEVGQIAQQYNLVMDRLQENLVAKSDYVSILDNVHEGLFLLDPAGTIGPFYSSALEKILEKKSLAGENFTKLLEPLISPTLLGPWKDFQEVLFDPNVDAQALSRLNPLHQVELWTGSAHGSDAVCHAQFQFRRILENGQVVRVMAVLRDVSAEVGLQKTIASEKSQREGEMELFYKILHLDPSFLSSFLQDFDAKTRQINALMETGQNTPEEVLKHTLRILHGIKGEAALLELDFLAEATHKLETEVQSLQKKKPLANSDFLSFALQLGRFQETGHELTRLVEKLSHFQASLVKADLDAFSALEKKLQVLVQTTARNQGKSVVLNTARFSTAVLLEKDLPLWQEVLVQMLRNAVVHGVEPLNIRQNLGKTLPALITLTAEKTLGWTQVTIRDDGRGLDLQALAQKALEKGYEAPVVARWSKTDYVRFLFVDGVSTAAQVSMDAGRGVGLSLVSRLIKERNGRLSVKFETGHFLEFNIALPDRS